MNPQPNNLANSEIFFERLVGIDMLINWKPNNNCGGIFQPSTYQYPQYDWESIPWGQIKPLRSLPVSADAINRVWKRIFINLIFLVYIMDVYFETFKNSLHLLCHKNSALMSS